MKTSKEYYQECKKHYNKNNDTCDYADSCNNCDLYHNMMTATIHEDEEDIRKNIWYS